jgi:hypothetical protein
MTKDKVTESLLDALKLALAEPGEQRLFKSGKLSGLFPSKSGPNAEAALQALRDGLLEVVRNEAKGKTTIEWVRLTPRGVNFVHDHESPVLVLRELRSVLQSTRDGVPAWLADLRHDVQALETRVTDEVQRVLHQLEALQNRVEEALRRADASGPQVPDGVKTTVPWALEALAYLDRRRSGGAAGECSLPELFAALREQGADLSLTAFHDGLRRLRDGRALRLLPFTDPTQQLPEPEYALLDGAAMFYYVAR